jgi:hypothetical protein
MAERIDTLIHDLKTNRAYFDAVLDQAVDREHEQVYSDELGWDLRALVVHVADADRGHNAQAMNIAEGRDIIPEDFDIQRYNRRTTEKNVDKSLEEARSDMNTTRQELIDWLQTIDESLLDKRGRHSTLEIMTAEEIIRFGMKHERNHADDIARVLNITV